MSLSLYWVDAFTAQVFAGNPAGVIPLAEWLPDATMQRVAFENGLSETAFFVRTGPSRFQLRWFTPKVEVDLCGHATLASAFVAFFIISARISRTDPLRFAQRRPRRGPARRPA